MEEFISEALRWGGGRGCPTGRAAMAPSRGGKGTSRRWASQTERLSSREKEGRKGVDVPVVVVESCWYREERVGKRWDEL